MTTTTPPRGARIYVELDEELTKILDVSRQSVRLKRHDFIRWILARQLLGTESLSDVAVESLR